MENNFFEILFGKWVMSLRFERSYVIQNGSNQIFPSYLDTLHVRVYFGKNKHTI